MQPFHVQSYPCLTDVYAIYGSGIVHKSLIL